MTRRPPYWTLLLVLTLVTVAAVKIAPAVSVFDQLDLLVDIRHEIVSQFVEEPKQEDMVRAAVRGMVESLDDPYTVYLSPDELEPFDKAVRGTFSGIGAEVDLHENRLRIVTPLEDSPAWKAGVMAGDIVLEIDGESTEGMKLTECIGRLTGEEGTDVTVRVRHESGEEVELTITRARINVQTVRGFLRGGDGKWDYMLDDARKIGYVRISQFTEQTAEAVEAAVRGLVNEGAAAVILDMRFNPGGLLESAVAVSDLFLGEGKRIVSIKGRRVPEVVHHAKQDGTIADIPMVVLASEASASAAEIVTGALSDNDRAVFIGTRTFGKGSVQQVRMLESNAGAIKITNAYYYLPGGRTIHRREGAEEWGVDPKDGFYVPMTPEETRAMIRTRRQSDVLKPGNGHNGEAVTSQWVRDKLADPQLAAALDAVVGRLDTGDWPKVGQSGVEELVKLSKRQSLVTQRDLLRDRLSEVEKELAKLDGKADAADDATPAEQPSEQAPEQDGQ
jgi:carboxyl-terminal processing protease